jgi:nucleotide-binding universal stress UspA family protein
VSDIDSILLPLDGSPESARPIGCALWLAEQLGATLHLLHAGERPLSATEALQRLGAATARHARTVLHQSRQPPVEAMLELVRKHDVKLVVMSARGESASAGVDPERQLGRVTTALLASSTLPVLITPLGYRESLPWRSILVAGMVAGRGDAAADDALATTLRLATALPAQARVVYAAQASAVACYADALHYELPHRYHELVSRATVVATRQECHHVEALRVRRGDLADELVAEAADFDLVALGWHGAFAAARAPMLTRLLERAARPLLIVRERQRSVLLKVGDLLCCD